MALGDSIDPKREKREAGDCLLGAPADRPLAAAARRRRLTSAQAALNGERRLLSSQLRDERTQFGDIAGYLKHALDEQTARAEGLQARLAEAQAALQAAAAAAQEAARAAEQRHAAEEVQWQARLEYQGDRLKEAEEFSEERAALQARADQLTAQLEAAAQAHHKRQLVSWGPPPVTNAVQRLA